MEGIAFKQTNPPGPVYWNWPGPYDYQTPPQNNACYNGYPSNYPQTRQATYNYPQAPQTTYNYPQAQQTTYNYLHEQQTTYQQDIGVRRDVPPRIPWAGCAEFQAQGFGKRLTTARDQAQHPAPSTKKSPVKKYIPSVGSDESQVLGIGSNSTAQRDQAQYPAPSVRKSPVQKYIPFPGSDESQVQVIGRFPTAPRAQAQHTKFVASNHPLQEQSPASPAPGPRQSSSPPGNWNPGFQAQSSGDNPPPAKEAQNLNVGLDIYIKRKSDNTIRAASSVIDKTTISKTLIEQLQSFPEGNVTLQALNQIFMADAPFFGQVSNTSDLSKNSHLVHSVGGVSKLSTLLLDQYAHDVLNQPGMKEALEQRKIYILFKLREFEAFKDELKTLNGLLARISATESTLVNVIPIPEGTGGVTEDLESHNLASEDPDPLGQTLEQENSDRESEETIRNHQVTRSCGRIPAEYYRIPINMRPTMTRQPPPHTGRLKLIEHSLPPLTHNQERANYSISELDEFDRSYGIARRLRELQAAPRNTLLQKEIRDDIHELWRSIRGLSRDHGRFNYTGYGVELKRFYTGTFGCELVDLDEVDTAGPNEPEPRQRRPRFANNDASGTSRDSRGRERGREGTWRGSSDGRVRGTPRGNGGRLERRSKGASRGSKVNPRDLRIRSIHDSTKNKIEAQAEL